MGDNTTNVYVHLVASNEKGVPSIAETVKVNIGSDK